METFKFLSRVISPRPAVRLCTDTIAKHLSNSPPCSDTSVKSPVSVVFYIYLSKSKNIYLNPVAPTRGTENLAFP